MEVVCQISNKKDLATLSAAWNKFNKKKKKNAGDWMAHAKWGAAMVELIPLGQFEPTHEYQLASAGGAIFIVDVGVASIFAGTD